MMCGKNYSRMVNRWEINVWIVQDNQKHVVNSVVHTIGRKDYP